MPDIADMTDLSREGFEKWVNNPHMLNRKIEPGYEDEYEHPWTAGAWAAWQEMEKRCSLKHQWERSQ